MSFHVIRLLSPFCVLPGWLLCVLLCLSDWRREVDEQVTESEQTVLETHPPRKVAGGFFAISAMV